MSLHQILIIGHILGTVMGLGGAIVAEAQSMMAFRDKNISSDEKALMHANYFLIRVGTALILISGLSLMWYYISGGDNWVLHSPALWVKEIMTAVIILNAYFLTKHWVPFWLGSALSLSSWLGAAILGAAGYVAYSFPQILGGYVVFIAIVAVTLHFLRRVFG